MLYSLVLSFLMLAVALAEPVTLMVYNLQNFLESEQYRKGEVVGTRYKPDDEIAAVVEVIVRHRPQILGLCEIGTTEDLAHLQQLLSAEGLDYPYVEHVEAADSARRLALLSTYPILERRSQTTLTYRIGGDVFPLRRGVLHVVLEVNGAPLHLVGVHLKSKRPSEQGDEALMRLKEAFLVRDHVEATLEEAPAETRLLLYGDCNDHYRSPPLNVLKGAYQSPMRLTPLDLKDANGQHWTHYWKYNRLYSTFDYALSNAALLPVIDKKASYIDGAAPVMEASDHRPLIVRMRL